MSHKIAIIGQSKEPFKKNVMNQARKIGELLAEKGCTIFTGGSTGYPYHAVQGAFEKGGETVGVSPGVNESHHKEEYGFPIEGFKRFEFTGKGIPERNYDLVDRADAVIMIGGKIGTLNEFTIAHHKGKIIGVLERSGGIIDHIKKISEICDENQKENVIYSSSSEDLVNKVLERLKNV